MGKGATFTAVAAVSGVVLLASCGSSGSSTAPATPLKTAVIAPPSTAPGSTTPGSRPAQTGDGVACQTSQLSLRIGQSTGATSHYSIPLIFTNTASSPCTIAGYPGVSYLASADGPQIGPAATRDGYPAGGTVRLAEGDSATADAITTSVGVFSKQQCGPTPAAGLRVYPPNNTAPIFLPSTRYQACSRIGVLTIKSVQPGIEH